MFVQNATLFFLWTLILYWIHRLGHRSVFIMRFHGDHHRHVLKHGTKWRPNNLLLFNDTWKSTVDLWLTEVIPTIIFSAVSDAWWIIAFYYVWAAFIQEIVEHNSKISVSFWSSGQWHLKHHYDPGVNYGLFFTVWDKVFLTEK